ncbi:uncharacterized protein LOC110049182 isoform X2 [Orbicella faveolata]|uniref:uncharacterized protein LOC110049182 isoform X2 n=1 Tax=Orbicella faveolata TaxID=48498 RepID=UPI0009E1CF3E|nr:uncharacterized protein LOC110049182 isoform X2 [Orbicella faveolata]
MHPENVTKRKGAMVTKTESITSVYWPLHSKVDSGVEIATLAGGASNIMLKEQSSEEEISQDARSFAEHFFEERSFEASKNERKSVCLSLVRKKRLAIAILTLLVIVGICLAAIFTLPADKKTPTPTTAVERMTTSRQACSNGLLTLSCEGITDVNAVHKVQWKIKFPGAGWNEFAYCYKYGMNCVVTRPVLSEGIKVLKVSNRSVSLQRIAKNNTNGYAQTMCQVLYKDNSLTIHVYKTNFTAKCVRIQGCKKISEVNREQVFWNRLQVTRGSLLLTAVQESDDGRTIRMKVDMKAPGKSSGRNVEANMESAHMYTIWIFVNTSRSPVFNDTKNEEWQMTIHEKATMPCPILQEVVNKDGTFDIVYWSLCTSKSCDDTHSTWDWIAGMNQEGTRAAVRSGINITSGGALEIQKVQLSDAGLYKCTVKRSDRSSPRISFATLFVNGVGVQADSKRIECLNEQIALECLGLESVIQNGTFLELFWKVTDPEDLKKQNIGYCNKDLNCTRYGNIGSFDRRINLSHPVRGILLVEQMVLNDRLSYTCAIERSGNKGPIVHKIIVTSSMHCLSSSAGQNLNLTQPFQAMFSMETVEDIEWYRISRDGAKVKIAYCNPSSTCILVEVCTSSCPEYLTRLKTDGLSIILSNVKQADRGLEFQCQIHHKIMTKGPRVYMIRIKAISPREDSTTEPSGTYTLRAIISEVKQDNETVGGYQPSLLPIWIPLSSCAVVVATAFIFIKCRSERRKKSRRKRRGCEAVESDDDDMTMLETTRLLLPPGADLLIKYLTTDEIRFIAHRLNGKDDHGDHLWEVIGQQLGFGAECRKWKSAEDPTETLLKAYGEQEGSTINNLIKALMEVGLTKFAEEIVRRRIKVWLNAQRGS